ncbi:chitobiase/beta-hexosaminidase C-terminal domain-containing protein [Mediterraneibacter agrestimuris]|uniref:chitobiase/beta-hexosaminidase C-terminal domain-containing protein n=1 Tax=Mediterraneibacter agrestimuris TaxID=2941333 RepID=UPI00203AA260|nr:chitobiase/beta-hexosaminidase C-terminal domain-containing protein [Mediterraneibacter agrestimuris]
MAGYIDNIETKVVKEGTAMKKTRMKIMKRWTTVLGTLAMLCTAPMTVGAEGEGTFYNMDISKSPITLSYDGDNGCKDNCQGHTIRGKSEENGIKVVSGKHKIIFDGVDIDFSSYGTAECAFDIAKGAEVELTLEGKSDNKLTSATNRAGIHVSEGAKLTISGEEGKLIAASKDNGAGIGGDAYSTSDGQAGEIIVESGTIVATGGNKAPGIGGKGAKIQLNGGDITATPGTGAGAGIVGELSSEYGEEVVVTTKGNLQNAENFNGVVWNQGTNQCKVYGNAVIGDTFKLAENQTMVIPENSSLTLKPSSLLGYTDMRGTIKGETKPGDVIVGGTLIADEALSNLQGIEGVTKKSVLKETDITTNTLPYKGIDLKELALTITNSDSVDAQIGWTKTIDGTPWEAGRIIDAGEYTITYNHPIHQPITKKVTVNPIDILDSAITIQNIPNQTYTGKSIEPTITVKVGNVVQTKGEDYIVMYENNIIPGSATVNVQGVVGGNIKFDVDKKKTVTFTIVPALIGRDDVAIDQDTYTYDGAEHKPVVTVSIEGTTLVEGTNYDLVYPGDSTSAGKKIITVTGKGNYGGKVDIEYDIQALPLTVTGAEADPLKREYDGTDRVSVSTVNLSGILTGDEQDVQVDTADLQGIVDSPNIGTYADVSFENLTLTGAKAGNYILTMPEGKVTLKESVEIIQAKGPAAPQFKDVDVYKVSLNDGNTFVYTVEIEDKIEDVQYEYRMDDGAWTDNNIFDGIIPESEHTFEARTKWTENVDTGEIGSTGKIIFKKLPQDPPKSFTMKYTLNEDKVTYTAIIPILVNGEYKFSAGEEYTTNNIKENCVPNTEYTGYVRFAETAVYEASEPVSDTQATPMATVELPVITPDGGQFISSQEVKISCETTDAVIYYTTDGKNPTTSSMRYEKPFTIDATTTVKAIAVKDGMKDSAMAAAQFVKASGDSVKSKLDIVEFTEESEVPEGLKDTEFNTPENIMVQLSRILTSQKGYTYDNIAYYDVTLEISLDGETWEPATIDNFPKNGVSITLPYPEGTGAKTHDFVVSHMFTESSERLGVTAGDTEEPPVTKTEEGAKFTVKSTSPIAIAWKEVAANNGTGGGDNNGTGNNGNNNNDGTDNNGNNNNGNNSNGTDNNGNNNNGANGTNNNGTNGTNNNGTNATGTNGTDANGTGTQSKAQNLLSSIMPKTGDPASFIPWIVLIAISVAAIITVVIKKRR